MFASIIATVFFSLSAIAANRSIAQLGSLVANVTRLWVAGFILLFISFMIGVAPEYGVAWIFIISGIIGFGFGDLGVFYALPRLGSRLTVLYVQCLAAPIAGVIEWVWLGTSLSSLQILFAVITLIGVAIALDPFHAKNFHKDQWISGSIFGIIGALGQGAGAVISRYGYDLAAASSTTVPAMTAACLRVWGGILVATIAWAALRKHSSTTYPSRTKSRTFIWAFIVLNGLAGPVLGVSAYQWALEVRPSFVVLPIVALSPIVVIPMAMAWEGDRPNLISILGAMVAVGSAIGLTLVTL